MPRQSSAPRGAVGIENDADANAVARRNAERNAVAHLVEFIDGDAGDMAPLLGPADLLLSNILRTVNTRLLPSIGAALRPDGLAIFSGMEEAEAPEFLTSLAVRWSRCARRGDRRGLVGRRRQAAVIAVLLPPGSGASGNVCRLDDGEEHHLRVRRAQPGERVALRDGTGLMGTGTLARTGEGWMVEVERAESAPRPPELVLAVAAGDRDRFGWLVEKAAELGVTTLVPIETARTTGVATKLTGKHLEKLRRQALEAIKQSGAPWATEIEEPVTLERFLSRERQGEKWLADANGTVPGGHCWPRSRDRDWWGPKEDLPPVRA